MRNTTKMIVEIVSTTCHGRYVRGKIKIIVSDKKADFATTSTLKKVLDLK